jgi:hypothetical protein
VTVRAVWHDSLVVVEGGDPFSDPDEPQRIEDVGTPIALNAEGERDALQRSLVRALVREGELEDQGVTCAIKNVANTSCHACPLYVDDGSPAAALCAVGRAQETLCTSIAVLVHGGRR